MNASHAGSWDQLCTHLRETALVDSIESVLQWDERTRLPPQAGLYRAEQLTYVAGAVHRRRTDPQLGEWLQDLVESSLAADPHSDTGATIRQTKRDYEKRTRVPQELVEALTRASVLGQQAWVQARKDDDYAAFAPHLQELLNLKRQQAEAVGYEETLYDALLDDFEPDAKTKEVATVLNDLREKLLPLVEGVTQSGRRPPLDVLHRHCPLDAQRRLGRRAAECIGFDFTSGWLDETAHPFCSSLGPHDCRISTRYDEHYFPTGFFSILHEAGHGIYDQGLPVDQYGLPTGQYVSLGVHESQSRLWENAVGRSRSFWEYFYPEAQTAFPQALGEVALEDFHFAVNHVQPSLIRVEADEVTYNLHIIIRFELEQALLGRDLTVADLPAAWREKYAAYLGIEPPNDADGVLQDIHWSAGLFGYFPTYSLGNLYGAQLFAAAEQQLGGLENHFARGEFEPLLQWLRENIHQHGQRYPAAELVRRATGKPLRHDELVEYLQRKLEPLYGV